MNDAILGDMADNDSGREDNLRILSQHLDDSNPD